jgi:prepilin-type N-terminal cleavage/methylation domain-containing protein
MHTTIDFLKAGSYYMKTSKGFTLVEVIVVAVIVAVLATVAATLYSGYIRDTEKSTVKNIAQTAAASANSYYRKTNTHPDSAKLNLFLPEPGRYSVKVNTSVTPPQVEVTDTKSKFKATATY